MIIKDLRIFLDLWMVLLTWWGLRMHTCFPAVIIANPEHIVMKNKLWAVLGCWQMFCFLARSLMTKGYTRCGMRPDMRVFFSRMYLYLSQGFNRDNFEISFLLKVWQLRVRQFIPDCDGWSHHGTARLIVSLWGKIFSQRIFTLVLYISWSSIHTRTCGSKNCGRRNAAALQRARKWRW